MKPSRYNMFISPARRQYIDHLEARYGSLDLPRLIKGALDADGQIFQRNGRDHRFSVVTESPLLTRVRAVGHQKKGPQDDR